MNKYIACLALAVVVSAFGRPSPHSPGFRGPYGPRVHHVPPHHHHHSGPFWTGVGLGLAGSLIAPAVMPPPPPLPPVVAVPPPLATRVWIPARTETRYDSFGRPYLVTIPGHWQY